MKFYKNGNNEGLFKKASNLGHLGLKFASSPITHYVVNALAGPNSGVAKVSGFLQKIKQLLYIMAKTVNKNKNKNIINIKINTEKKVKHRKLSHHH